MPAMKSDSILHVWEELRTELRRLRGQNLFRGNEEHLLQKHQVWLHKENRGSQLKSDYFILHLEPRPEDFWAERSTGGLPLRVEDFGGDWKAWLRAIVDECRGGPYLHTNSQSADYRKPGQEIAKKDEI
jgi:hypothetical protein